MWNLIFLLLSTDPAAPADAQKIVIVSYADKATCFAELNRISWAYYDPHHTSVVPPPGIETPGWRLWSTDCVPADPLIS